MTAQRRTEQQSEAFGFLQTTTLADKPLTSLTYYYKFRSTY